MKIIRCARCKRILTGKAAKYWGMGSTCIKKNPGLAAQVRAEMDGQMRLPLQGIDASHNLEPSSG